MQLKIFDVEHGACALLTCDNAKNIMIDAGHNATTGWKPGDYLVNLGIKKLDMLVVTNYDEDHASGLPNLLAKVHVDWFLGNPTVSSQVIKLLKSEEGIGTGIELLSNVIGSLVVRQTPQPNFLGVVWRACWNCYPYFSDENNLSVVFHLSINGTGFLFPGDLEDAGWKNLLTTYKPLSDMVKTTHVLMASHHGRDDGICTELFDNYGCRPQVVVISDDYHQYDTQKTTAYYKSKCSGINGFREQGKRWVLTTRNDGDITFSFNQHGCTVS